VNKLTDCLEFLVAGDFLLEEILHRLDIMIGGALDVLDALRILLAELVDYLVQDALGMHAEQWHFRDIRLPGKCLQPANLDHHAVTDQAVFTENRAQCFGFGSIAPVNR